jgi:circadian clock protein KaiC
MLRYQQQYSFFDPAKLTTSVRFINLGHVLFGRGLNGILEEIAKEVETNNPGIVVVDSFRTVARAATGELDVQGFVQNIGLMLTSCEATTFLIGEYAESEIRDNPVFTVADGLFWLSQTVERKSIVRKLQIMKLRGQASVPGLHTFRITDNGIQAFSRTLGLTASVGWRRGSAARRLSMGNAGLDEMMGGGVPEGDSLLVAGSSGTGKSLLASQFIAAGLREGEPGIIVVFEERPESYTARARSFGLKLDDAVADGSLRVVYLRPLDLSVDETMQEILDAIRHTKARRFVIDSIAGFELALGFRTDFRESLYRMVYALTGIGITIVSTVELEESFTDLPFSTYTISFLTDDIIRLRFAEIDGCLCKILMVVKMRGGAHSTEIRRYEINSDGLVIGERIRDYDHLITGIPTRTRKT